MKRKIEAMHAEYGARYDYRCKNCCNFVSGRNQYSKCIAYGVSGCEATDWSRRHVACGLFGEDFEAKGLKPLLDVLKKSKKEIDADGMDGQMSLF